VAGLAALLADDTRATFCLALLDGRPGRPASWPARVAPSTATGHLHRLVRGGLLAEERQAGTATSAGRPEVAELSSYWPPGRRAPPEVHTLKAASGATRWPGPDLLRPPGRPARRRACRAMTARFLDSYSITEEGLGCLRAGRDVPGLRRQRAR